MRLRIDSLVFIDFQILNRGAVLAGADLEVRGELVLNLVCIPRYIFRLFYCRDAICQEVTCKRQISVELT